MLRQTTGGQSENGEDALQPTSPPDSFPKTFRRWRMILQHLRLSAGNGAISLRTRMPGWLMGTSLPTCLHSFVRYVVHLRPALNPTRSWHRMGLPLLKRYLLGEVRKLTANSLLLFIKLVNSWVCSRIELNPPLKSTTHGLECGNNIEPINCPQSAENLGLRIEAWKAAW